MVPLRDRVYLWAISMKRYFEFLKVPALLEPHHHIISYHIEDISYVQYASAEILSVYSTLPANWVCIVFEKKNKN